MAADYCREIETYLCKKNDGHLIRVVGPSFEIVSSWETDGVPLKVAFRGIDRYFERYYRKGPRRRPVRIDSCAADVLDVFDEWRRAIGMTASGATGDAEEPGSVPGPSPAPAKSGASVPAHLERVLRRLTSARVNGTIGEAVDSLIDRLSAELDRAKAAGSLRGEARRALIGRLAELDDELIRLASDTVDAGVRASLERDASDELAEYRVRMAPDAYARAHAAAVRGLLRERLNLPTLTL